MAAADGSKLSKNFTLAELLDTDFVVCENCGSIYTSPLLLPCLHTFCQKCVIETIARENADKLTGEEQNTASIKHEEAQLDNGAGQLKIDSDRTNHVANGHGNTDSKDHYTFNCPTCKSQITIETGCSLDSKCSIDEEEKHKAQNRTTGATNGLHKAVDDENSSKPSSVQSLAIPASRYRRLKNAIQHSLPNNHFVESMTRLYKYRNEVGRECAYCKTEDVVEKATCLCLQCGDDVCDGCAGAHRKTRITRDHSVVSYTAIQQGLFDHDIRKATGITCDDHPKSDVTHFCNDCLKVVCKHCRSKQHHNHDIHHLTEAASKLTQDILNVQEGLSRRIPDLSQYIEFLSQQLTSLQQRHDTATLEINTQVQLIHQMVDDWRGKTISNLDAAVTQERKAIQDKIDNFNVSKNATEKSASFLLHLYNLGKADEKMGSYPSIMRRYQQLIRAKPKAMTSRLGISFTSGPTTDQNIRILIGQLGLKQEELSDKDTPKSRLPISSLMPATLESPELLHSWNICSSSSASDTTVDGTKRQSPQGRASCYISGIDVKGNLLAAVDRNNAKVIIVDQSSRKVVKEFTGNGAHKLRKPFDVVFLPSGALAITDPEASAVRVFDWTGNYLFTFEGADVENDKSRVCKGRKDKEQVEEGDREQSLRVRHPRGITLSKKGEVVVLDGHLRHCTVHDSSTGKILWTIYPHKEISPKQNGHKNDVTNNVSNNDSDSESEYDSSNTEQKSHKPETELLDVILVDPFYICTTPDDNLVITDAASPNVKILGWPSGRLLQESLDYGIRQEECLHPTGICVDHKSGYILLVDTNNNRIHLGLPDGHFSNILIPSTLSKSTTTTTTTATPTAISSGDNEVSNSNTNNDTVNDTRARTGQLSHPTCLCLDQDGHIIVAQVGGNINVYKYL